MYMYVYVYTALSTIGAGECSGHLSSGVDLYKYTYSSPRTRSVMGSQFFFEKRKSCPRCISLPLLVCHVHVHVYTCYVLHNRLPFAIVCVCMNTEATLVIYMCSSKPVFNKAELNLFFTSSPISCGTLNKFALTPPLAISTSLAVGLGVYVQN